MFKTGFDYSNAQEPGKFALKSRAARILVNVLVTLIFAAVYFYVSLPAINPQAQEFYMFIGILCAVYIICSLITSGFQASANGGAKEYFKYVKSQCKISGIIILLLVAVGVVGTVSSWPVIRANSYKKLLEVQPGDFASEVTEISYDKIPMLDEDSAERLGDRKLGELSDMVSQFEVSDDYTQINYNNRPVRVACLEYGDVIKWFNNRSRGLPAYIVIDMVTQNVDVVRLEDGIKYSKTEIFGRKLERHLRFNYPTYMFANATFEVDEQGNPYWVCPRIVKRIGLFGGEDIRGAVLVNACTGESKYYAPEEIPTWVDRVYTASLIIEQYDYYGTYRNGFLNSIFGQKDVTVTTDGYNYIALNDDIWVYTGITSVGGDQSNVGFILSNQRTKETRYYSCAGAAEYSAMASAEGVVQHLGYAATFPLLLNISSQPTYFMALKDRAELVKMYAMVNVSQYQIVATGNTVAECEKEYIRLMLQHGITQQQAPIETQASGVISEIRSAVIGGNTMYYIRLANDAGYYVISAAESELAVILNVGDTVEIIYDEKSQGELRRAVEVRRS